VRLSVETERRLEALAARTGRTKTYYAREAIEAHLDELEDFYLAEDRLRTFRDRDAASVADAIGGTSDTEAVRADLVDTLRRLWLQGEASGPAVAGNFDAADIARRGGERLRRRDATIEDTPPPPRDPGCR
jgi:RHH-type rel operon transcriptional repressor/antitoxin RelB